MYGSGFRIRSRDFGSQGFRVVGFQAFCVDGLGCLDLRVEGFRILGFGGSILQSLAV